VIVDLDSIVEIDGSEAARRRLTPSSTSTHVAALTRGRSAELVYVQPRRGSQRRTSPSRSTPGRQRSGRRRRSRRRGAQRPRRGFVTNHQTSSLITITTGDCGSVSAARFGAARRRPRRRRGRSGCTCSRRRRWRRGRSRGRSRATDGGAWGGRLRRLTTLLGLLLRAGREADQQRDHEELVHELS